MSSTRAPMVLVAMTCASAALTAVLSRLRTTRTPSWRPTCLLLHAVEPITIGELAA